MGVGNVNVSIWADTGSVTRREACIATLPVGASGLIGHAREGRYDSIGSDFTDGVVFIFDDVNVTLLIDRGSLGIVKLCLLWRTIGAARVITQPAMVVMV